MKQVSKDFIVDILQIYRMDNSTRVKSFRLIGPAVTAILNQVKIKQDMVIIHIVHLPRYLTSLLER